MFAVVLMMPNHKLPICWQSQLPQQILWLMFLDWQAIVSSKHHLYCSCSS